MCFARWQWYYNKTQHTSNTYHTKYTTLEQNTAHKTTKNNKGHTTQSEYTASAKRW
jgi:hypothetical protein